MGDLVSVVMPNFNGARFIDEAIRSALAQTYGDLELIIVDDCSTDDSRDIITAHAHDDPRVRSFHHADRFGPAAARNRAIAEARGRYIAFLDSDDMWEPSKLARQIPLHESTDCVLSYTSYQGIDETGKALGAPVPVPPRILYDDLLKTCAISCATAIYDTRKVGKVYMPSILRRQDYALWLRLLRGGRVAHGCPDCLARYRFYRGSLSSNKLVAARYHWRVLRTLEHQSLLPAAYYFVHYAMKGTAKFLRWGSLQPRHTARSARNAS
jgi:teichuronic acid biosynthesis glycosyltransferase TuaG